jgi:hypothetical protein
MPSQEEMFRLLQHLSLKCQILTEEVDKLKTSSSISRRKTTESLLESLKPNITFNEWAKSFIVNDDCIQEICNKNLTDGIIKCILNKINDENDTDVELQIRIADINSNESNQRDLNFVSLPLKTCSVWKTIGILVDCTSKGTRAKDGHTNETFHVGLDKHVG